MIIQKPFSCLVHRVEHLIFAPKGQLVIDTFEEGSIIPSVSLLEEFGNRCFLVFVESYWYFELPQNREELFALT